MFSCSSLKNAELCPDILCCQKENVSLLPYKQKFCGELLRQFFTDKMQRKNLLKWSALSCLTFLLAACGIPGEERKAAEPATKLTFAYLTDVHLNKDNSGNGNEGLRKALKAAADNGAEFLLFGGDNADTDALGDAETTADTLHARFTRLVEETGLPAYYTIGNHDRYYRFEGQPDTLGFRMFEKHYGPSHRSFTRKGVHFVILNSLYPEDNGGYNVGNKQLEWLKADLDSVGKQTPVIVSTHVPMLSLYYPVVEGSMKALDMINDTKAVVDVLKDHNTQLVLQGHQHIYEQIQERDLWFVTAGAVSAYWWKGPFLTTEEGLLLVKVDENNRVSWEYLDYGWEVKEQE